MRHTLPLSLLASVAFAACVLDTAGLAPPETGASVSSSVSASSTGGAGPTSSSDASVSSSGAGTGGEGGLMKTNGVGVGGGGGSSECGNGVVEIPEECDDQNDTIADGCSNCLVDVGWFCNSQPSACSEIPAQTSIAGPNLGLSIADNGSYDGTIASMDCATVTVPDNGFYALQEVEVVVAIDHNYVGDLVFKLVSPTGTILTLMSRPGHNEPADAPDGANGDTSNLRAGYPITFVDGAATSAEDMGAGLATGGEVCKDGPMICEYAPAPGAGPGTSLNDFKGEDPTGNWQFCVGDADSGTQGTLQQVTLSTLAWQQ